MSAYKRFIFASDIHGKHKDNRSCEVVFKFSEIWKPEVRICGGDLWDFTPLRKGASANEQAESLLDDFDAGKEWFESFKTTHLILGNHDQRIFDLAEHGTGAGKDLAVTKVREIEAMTKSAHCQVFPYHKRKGVLRIGKLKALHGFFAGLTAARQMALVYGSCIFGHVHAIDEHSIAGLEHRVARSAGCLCSLDLDYAARTPSTLRQSNGFIYGVINKTTGTYNTWQAKKIDGHWLIPSDIVEL